MAAGDVASGKTVAAEQSVWICFEDEAGQTLHRRKPAPGATRTYTRGGRPVYAAVVLGELLADQVRVLGPGHPRGISKSVWAGSGRDDRENQATVSGDPLNRASDLGDPARRNRPNARLRTVAIT